MFLMEFILHFSVHCANIRVFCENAKGLGVFFLKSTCLSFFNQGDFFENLPVLPYP